MKTLHSLLGLTLLFLTLGMAQAQTSILEVVGAEGPRSQRLNMVFLSEGFTQAELDAGKFSTHVDGVLAYLFAQEPWSRYRSYFNVYLIEIASNQSGTDNPYGNPAYTRDTYFSTGFHPQIERLLVLSSAGTSRAYSLLNKHVPEYDIPIVIVNDETYGGSGGPIAVASLDSFGAELVEHEVGHSFAKLADEYDFDTPGYPDGEFPNATRKTVLSQIRWNMWIEPGTPLFTPEYDPLYTNKVGHFEGAHYRSVGYFRPHDAALMRFLGAAPGAVTREAFVLNYYSRVSPVDSHSPVSLKQTVTQRTLLSFSVVPKAPTTGPGLTVSWKVDGVALLGLSNPTFNVPSQNLGEGTHTVTAVITDPTEWVRRDPTGLVEETRTWTLTLSNQGEPPVINDGPASLLVEVGDTASFNVDATAAGPGVLTYQWYKNGKAIANAKTASFSVPSALLSDGAMYTVRVMGDGAFVEASADLVVVDPRVQTLVLAEGKTAALTPIVSGPVQGYQWLRNSTVIGNGTAGFSGLGTAKLNIFPLAVNSHNGTYSVKLTTDAGEETYVTHQLEIFNQPPQLALSAGASLPAGQVAAIYEAEIVALPIPGKPASTYGATGLPPGLKVDAKTGRITGRPTAFKADKAGNVIPYAVTLSAGNGKGTTKVTVNLLISPLPQNTVGTFVAALPRHGLNGGLGGRIDLVTTATGTYSGKVVMGSLTYSFKGLLTSTVGVPQVTGAINLPRAGKPTPASLELSFTLIGPPQLMVGILGANGDGFGFNGWLNPWSKANAADAYDGYYTFQMDLFAPPVGIPAGKVFGSYTVAADGKTLISGRTPDGETFTGASHLGLGGQLMLFSLQKGKPQGSVVGAIRINSQGDQDDANNSMDPQLGQISWWKPESTDPKARVYKDGVGPVDLLITGGRYNPPVSPQVVLNLDPGVSNAVLRFTGASLSGVSNPPGTELDILAGSKAQPSEPLAANTTLTFNPKLGTFTGKFSLLDANPREIAPLQVPRVVTYQGIITKGGSTLYGYGFFLLPDLPSVSLEDTPTTSPIQSGAVNLIKVTDLP
ncbi:M64 family metallopeptidase [Prosthecobacter dejongeii]|uniref:Ig-like domain-containing protein n=1 Tax=Prosthecobacter dejongeii TaxID=48465 RepID=A0A7W7YHI0_9BACT|nr:M64 family metallopeptidase [Prosthecobacter dejongeii]MBB5036224.1 hypothetical protein [Prosthecobacter dejongeii]